MIGTIIEKLKRDEIKMLIEDKEFAKNEKEDEKGEAKEGDAKHKSLKEHA